MSGTESFSSNEAVHASAADIQQYIETGTDGADKLLGAYYSVAYRSDGTKVYENNPYGILRSKSGEDISSVWGNFNDWMGKRNATIDQHDEYLKLKDAQPGRDSTIVGFTTEKAGTVLGQKLPYQKTVLG